MSNIVTRNIRRVYFGICNGLLNLFPDESVSAVFFRPFILRHMMGNHCGAKVTFCGGSTIRGDTLSLGKGCFINRECYFDLTGPVVFGDNVYVSHRCTFITAWHDIGPQKKRVGSQTVGKAIRIGEGTWVGANVTIMPGIKIGKGCIVGACSLVTKDVPDNVIVKGIPAKVHRKLETKN